MSQNEINSDFAYKNENSFDLILLFQSIQNKILKTESINCSWINAKCITFEWIWWWWNWSYYKITATFQMIVQCIKVEFNVDLLVLFEDWYFKIFYQ